MSGGLRWVVVGRTVWVMTTNTYTWIDPRDRVHNENLLATALHNIDALDNVRAYDETIYALVEAVPEQLMSFCPHEQYMPYMFNPFTGVEGALFRVAPSRICSSCASELGEDGEIFVLAGEQPASIELVGRGSGTGGQLQRLGARGVEPWQGRQLALATLLLRAAISQREAEDLARAARNCVMQLAPPSTHGLAEQMLAADEGVPAARLHQATINGW